MKTNPPSKTRVSKLLLLSACLSATMFTSCGSVINDAMAGHGLWTMLEAHNGAPLHYNPTRGKGYVRMNQPARMTASSSAWWRQQAINEANAMSRQMRVARLSAQSRSIRVPSNYGNSWYPNNNGGHYNAGALSDPAH